MAEDNRTKILDFAVAAIDAGGEAAVRVHHIAAQAGLSVPMIYHYFDSRDGLVIAAQAERFTRQSRADITAIGRAVARCTTRDEVRTALRVTWERSFAERYENRWRRINALGSAYARPELETAIARAQDEIVALFAAILGPCRDRGWLRAGIDLPTAIAWQHGVLLGRVFVEHGTTEGDPSEWDRLTLEALDRAFFGE